MALTRLGLTDSLNRSQTHVDYSTTILGQKSSMPIYITATVSLSPSLFSPFFSADVSLMLPDALAHPHRPSASSVIRTVSST